MKTQPLVIDRAACHAAYHCSIYVVDEVNAYSKVNFKPFDSAEHMTEMLGISVDEWKRRQAAKKSQRRAKHSGPKQSKRYVNIFEQLRA